MNGRRTAERLGAARVGDGEKPRPRTLRLPGPDTLTDDTEEAQPQARDAEALRSRFRALRRAVSPYSDREQYIVRARHELMKTVLDGALTVSKLPPDTRNVIDVGCGFGPWATDVARQYPGARVTGMDLAPITATDDAPANLRFVEADVNAPWAFAAPASADLVHMRALTESIAHWPFALGQAFGALRPGGVVEINELRPVFFDFDGQFAVTAAFPELLDMYLQLAASIGIDLDPIPKLPGWLNDAGFERIAQRSEILPLGLWPKDGKLRRRAELYTDLMLNGGG